MIHAIMLRERAQLGLEVAVRRRGERSGSSWPFLLRVACLLAIVIAAVTIYRKLIPPNVNAVSQRDVVSSDRASPQMASVAPRSVRTAGWPAATAPAQDTTAVPLASTPPVPAAKPLDRIPPPESSTGLKPPLSPVSEMPKLAARTAPNEPTGSAAATQGERSADDRKIVLSVQRALKKRGYDPEPADGLAGQQTEQAIRKFQADRGLTPRGGINYPLLRALDLAKER
jgi:hypothetical protein